MKPIHKRLLTAALVVVVIAVGLGCRPRGGPSSGIVTGASDNLVLLLPDDANLNDPAITVWLDAGREQGLHLRPIKASEFVGEASNPDFAGVVIPDKVHQAMDNGLISSIRSYVHGGGALLLAFDAGTWTPDHFFVDSGSRFKDLTGANYALYGALRANQVIQGPIFSTPDVLDKMDIPPGKFMRTPAGKAIGPKALTLEGYQREFLTYPYFATKGAFHGRVLMSSPKGLVAGVNKFGTGKVLFVNLPLGYLAGRTDGVMLHSFLKYFSERVLTLPRMAAVPDGMGGMVMNWHVDSNADVKYVLQTMKALGIYEQGPYSIHITAGPDTRKPGDHLGVNVPGDSKMQQWVKQEADRGNAIGSHGGWIHDYFGKGLTATKVPMFENFLKLNKDALEKAKGSPVTEYSAPVGNHPQWVSQWLADRNVLGYYFTGDTGMAPTRNYRNGKPEVSSRPIWAFPVTNLGMAGSFEEISRSGLSRDDVKKWLRDVTKFCATGHVSRLIYFHPNGTRLYPQAIMGWLAEAKAQQKVHHFRWYTMTRLATFLNDRDKVQWTVTRGDNGMETFTATHPTTLAHQAWMLPVAGFAQPKITAGAGTVRKSDGYWIVAAREGKALSFVSR